MTADEFLHSQEQAKLQIESVVELALKSVSEANQYMVKFEEDKSKNPGHKILRSLADYCFALGHEQGYAEGHKDGKNGKDKRVVAHTN